MVYWLKQSTIRNRRQNNLTLVIKYMWFNDIKMRYSTEPRNRIYIKEYGFLPFAKITGTHLSNKSGQNLLDSAKKPATDAKTTPKRAIQKTGEATGDLIVNKIADKITSVSKKYSVQYEKLNNDTTNDETEVPKKRYISPEEKQQIIDELRLVQQYNNGISKNS